jgi:glycosyltransferase involved in cell wall biosynthesis
LSFLDQVTVLILTYNEAPNIGRTLAALARFPHVVVLDSGSDDETAAIVRAAPNARLAVRRFDSHAEQWNHGLSLVPPQRPWVLALDADYILTEDLTEEMAGLDPETGTSAFRARVTYCIGGRPLRGSLYPPATILFRRGPGRYLQTGHTQRLEVEGQILRLNAAVLHDDRKPLERWFEAQLRYARLEADHLLANPPTRLRRVDRLRRWGWLTPLLVLPYTLIVKRCLFDGPRGWFYALQRLVAESMISLAILERRLTRTDTTC